MSVICCKEFKAWCKSFTRTEIYLSVCQVLFFVVLIVSLTFTILHFLACNKNEKSQKSKQIIQTTNQSSNINKEEDVLDKSTTEKNIISHTPLPKDIECTWTPSEKTTAASHYYDTDFTLKTTIPYQTSRVLVTSDSNELISTSSWTSTESVNEEIEGSYDGIEADAIKKAYLLALVKIKPSQDITFGCTLTIVALSWAITAASCIEAIEEVDSLDSFVMMKNFGEQVEGSIHVISDILIHPEYQGVNRSYDLAALRSEDSIVKEKSEIITLPTMVDYLSVTIGEKLSILGYGKYRNLDKDPRARSVRDVSVYSLPSQQCAAERAGEAGETWAPRHLAAGRAERRGACGARPLCAGALRARARPCRYCAGAPLLLPRRRALLGLMADDPHCGLACDPALYVNLALLRNWLDSVIDSD
ncbi:unnamed protein product [Euphydryas editha]|uniref:Peptidase S1 domain-containing protein n=1 Tax=Euphydryas editha TaxID=104508 RepID=A0AAU9UR64_EUPED|nr:unnamed protein product [Euphydryas editha]